ncbi:MAG: hypothetical protein HY651_04435 [Acidobacteria bacterium]|nr:hypothetical protein [Acidobacteriota bacterium]
MSLTETSYGQPFPRRQAQLLVELLTRQDSALRSVLTGRRREGKSDLLRQLQSALFEKADGPMPFRYVFEPRRDAAAMARHFAASFCQQMRSFGMRQEEMLGEPLARLEKELERPGLPLALTELGREFLSLPPADQMEFAAALPAQFAYREGRPLCLLLDDADVLNSRPEFLSYLNDSRLSWLITGRNSQLQGIAASHSWSIIRLVPFTLPEALSLAEDRCRQFELPFAPQAWENWFELAGTSPCWVHQLIEAAVVASQALNSTEALGRIYVRELASGSLGSWMQGRWQKVFSGQSAAEKTFPDGKEQRKVAEQLIQASGVGSGSGDFPPGLLEVLGVEDWAQDTPLGPVVRLERIERDWLELALSAANIGSDRAQAGFLQAFLLRAEGVRQWRQAGVPLTELKENLLQLPHSGLTAAASTRGSKELRLPAVCSIAMERTAAAELYWCHGFRAGWPEERRDRPEAACLYLIALCRQEPTGAEVKQWSRRLQEEIRSLPVLGGAEKASGTGLGPRYELWLALPKGASLAAVAGERRLRWEGLSRLLEEKGPPSAETLPPLLELQRSENQARLSELEARAQWLEEELATAREQFRQESSQPDLAGRTRETEMPSPQPLPMTSRPVDEPGARMALSVSLLQASADLLALQSQNDPAVLESVREIQRRSQQLADALREQEERLNPESSSRRSAEPPSAPES